MEFILKSFRYLFSVRPDPNFHFTKLAFAVIVLMVVAGVLIKIARLKWVKDEIMKKMLRRYPDHLFSFSIALAILLLFREAGMPVLSMRIWWVGYAVVLLIWIVKAVAGLTVEYRLRKDRHLEKESIKRYLPVRKKH